MKKLFSHCLNGIKGWAAPAAVNESPMPRTFEVIPITSKEQLLELGDLKKVEDILGKQVGTRMSVMQLSDGRHAILVQTDWVQSGLLDDVYAECQRKLRGHSVAVYAVEQILLLSLLQVGKEQTQAPVRAHSHNEAAFDLVVKYALERNCSDITFDLHLDSPASQISFQIGGVFVRPEQWLLPTAQVEGMLKMAWQKITGGSSSTLVYSEQLQGKVTLDLQGQKVALRWMSLGEDRGVSVTLRVAVEGRVSSIEDLDYLPDHLAAFRRNQASAGGILAIAGRVGQGKTRLTSAMLNRLPRTWKVIEIGDPIEIKQPHIIQTTVEKRIDKSSDATFVSKVAAFKRSAPDAVSLGEIGDALTGRGVIEVGGMGTQCYITLHATGHVNVAERLASHSIQIPRDFLASPGMLRLIVYQALVPKLCSCALPLVSLQETGGVDSTGAHQSGPYWRTYADRVKRMFGIDSTRLQVRNPAGCPACRHPEFQELNGYQGRTPILEYLEPNSDYRILQCIAAGDALALQQLLNSLPRDANDQPGMKNKSIAECAIYKALQGQIDPRDIERASESFETMALTERYQSTAPQEAVHELDRTHRPILAAVPGPLPVQPA